MMRMDQEIDGGRWSGARPASSPSTPGAGRDAADTDLWLRRNVLTCSEQEYLRYRAYLDAEPIADEVAGAQR